ncbi:MAG TPA: pyrroline-5-carboxylate reductase [Acidimicrobiales bacterium]|nr:pyrroline-5-carboxylate reductase [Acidimicrobiales bacterium]
MDKKLQVIGGGKMGEALLGGLISTGWALPEAMHIVEPDSERREYLQSNLQGVSLGTEPLEGIDALIAVKPHIVSEVCLALCDSSVKRVLSIAAGITLSALENSLKAGTAVLRAMPNTPSLVGQGASGLAGGSVASEDDLTWAVSILSAVGGVVVVEESDLDAVTGVSGSGPAYVFLLAEKMIEAAVAEGLTHEVGVELTERTLLGAATLLRESDDPPSVLRENVTSKGGTTAAGLAVFEQANFSDLIKKVVKAAADRSRELGAS